VTFMMVISTFLLSQWVRTLDGKTLV
jgi:hypothetical protein